MLDCDSVPFSGLATSGVNNDLRPEGFLHSVTLLLAALFLIQDVDSPKYANVEKESCLPGCCVKAKFNRKVLSTRYFFKPLVSFSVLFFTVM